MVDQLLYNEVPAIEYLMGPKVNGVSSTSSGKSRVETVIEEVTDDHPEMHVPPH